MKRIYLAILAVIAALGATAACAQDMQPAAIGGADYVEPSLTDPQLAAITGMALGPEFRFRAESVVDSDAAGLSRQFASISRTILDNWLNDVAAPLIANNQYLSR